MRRCKADGRGHRAAVARDALDREGWTRRGSTASTGASSPPIIEQYERRPAGLEAIAATINDEAGDSRGGGGALPA
mgnify:CR=1 FL=1